MMKRAVYLIIVLLQVFTVKAQVTLSTNFSSPADRKAPLHDAWQVANDISPTYEGFRDRAQIRPDLKMNVIRLSGGIRGGSGKDTDYDMVRWSNAANDYVYDFSRLLRVIDKADQHSDEIYQLVIDNVPWCFQRGYTFVDLDKYEFDGVHFRRFEEVEQYGNALPPSDMAEYGDYVEALMQTLVDNYGMARVRQWRFRVGSEIESPGHWKGTAEEFVDYLDVSMRAIRKIVPNAHVGIHTREPNYRAVRHRGVNYKGEPFVSFHNEILDHCAKNNLRIDSWGLSYYIQFDRPGSFDASESWYRHAVAPLVNHPQWNHNTEINLEEFKATASFRSPDGRFATLKSASSHGQVAHIAMSNLFYKHKELDQIHRWLQYENVKDEVANQELLAMVGNIRYETTVSGTPDHTSNSIDGIVSYNEETNTYEALIYNYNDESTDYVPAQDVNLSLVTDLPVGATVRFRTSHYTRSHNKLQSFTSEPFFQESWYIDGTEVGQRLGEASRILKDDIYTNQYRDYDGHLDYGFGNWMQTTTVPRSDGNSSGSEIAIETSLYSFSFRKFEFNCENCSVNTAPQVAFASPSGNLTLTEGYSPFQILANATDADGQGDITNVQLLLDGTLVRQESLAPYEWNHNPALTEDDVLDNLSSGTHELQLIVTDNQGATGEATLTITVIEANQNPILSFTTPLNNETFDEGTAVVINVAASDPNTNGSIANVKLYLDGTFIRQESIAPYDWNPANHPEDTVFNNLSAGTHTLRAVAEDDQGATSETSITIRVNALPPDCEGTPGGNIGPGSPCDDGDPCTINDVYDNNCKCGGELVLPEVTTTITDERCNEPGSIQFTFADVVSRTNIEFSINDGATYPLNVRDDAGTASFDNLAPETYNVWVRWGNGECPVDLGKVTVDDDPQPNVIVSTTDVQADGSGGSINFTFEDTPRRSIEFSMDGGATYPLNVLDNIGSASFENVTPGTYDVWVRWGNNQCPVDLGEVTIRSTSREDCANIPDGSATIDDCGICSGGTTGIEPSSPAIWYADTDGDGVGDESTSVEDCEQPAGYVACNGDQCPNDGNKTTPGTCGCGIAEGNCGPDYTPPAGYTYAAGENGIVDVSGTMHVAYGANGTFNYLYNQTSNIGCNNGTFGDPVFGVVKKCYVKVKELEENNEGPILGPNCATADSTVNFELAESYRANATSYSWWLQGASTSISSPSGQPHKTTIALSPDFDGGEVCVGVNFSNAPYYTSYCKKLSECVSADAASAGIDANVYPNPAEGRTITIETSANAGAIEQVSVQDGIGNVVYRSSQIQDGESIDLSGVSQGTYYLQINTSNGVITKPIILL